jgi:hypothetical protein
MCNPCPARSNKVFRSQLSSDVIVQYNKEVKILHQDIYLAIGWMVDASVPRLPTLPTLISQLSTDTPRPLSTRLGNNKKNRYKVA